LRVGGDDGDHHFHALDRRAIGEIAREHGLCCTSTRRCGLGDDPPRVPLDVEGSRRDSLVLTRTSLGAPSTVGYLVAGPEHLVRVMSTIQLSDHASTAGCEPARLDPLGRRFRALKLCGLIASRASRVTAAPRRIWTMPLAERR